SFGGSAYTSEAALTLVRADESRGRAKATPTTAGTSSRARNVLPHTTLFDLPIDEHARYDARSIAVRSTLDFERRGDTVPIEIAVRGRSKLRFRRTVRAIERKAERVRMVEPKPERAPRGVVPSARRIVVADSARDFRGRQRRRVRKRGRPG